MENKKLSNNQSNYYSRKYSGTSSKFLLSPSNSKLNNINYKRNQSQEKLFSPKHQKKMLLMKTSNSIIMSKQSVRKTEEKSVNITEKCLTEHNNSEKKEEGNKLINRNSKENDISEEIRQKVFKIFNNFAKYSKEESSSILSQQALIKILRFMNLLNDKDLKLSDIDIILKKVCVRGTKLNQEQFLDFIAQLAYKLNPQSFLQNPKETILIMIKAFFDPFLDLIDKPNQPFEDQDLQQPSLYVQLSIPYFVDKFEIDAQIISLIMSIYPGLKEVYTYYFIYEVNDYVAFDIIIKEGFITFVEFCRDYEITPYFLNLNQLGTYWNHINNVNSTYRSFPLFDAKKDLGKVFTLSKFGMMFIHFGIMTFDKFNLPSQNYSEIEKVIFFLEKIESSKGCLNFERKTNKPHKSSVTFLPPKDLVKQLSIMNDINSSVLSDQEKEKKEVVHDRYLLRNFNQHKKTRMENNLREILTISPDVIAMIEEKLDIFKEIYSSYAKLGDKLNFNKLSYSGFLKFLKDCDLIHQAQISNTNSSNELTNVLSSRTFSPMKKIVSTPSSNSLLKNSQKIATSYLIRGRLIESEAFCIFCTLTGYQNFDNSSKIKNHFNLNKGFAPKIGEVTKDVKMIRSKLLTTSKSNVPMKMDFNLYIKSFELLGKKLYPGKTLDEAVINFIESNFKKLLSHKEEELNCGKRLIIEILQKIRKEDVIDLLKDIHHVVLIHYENYCNNLGYMDFEQFFSFYKDFGIFPEFINLVELRNIFFALSDILYSHYKDKDENHSKDEVYTQTESNKTVKEFEKKIKELLSQNEYINFDLFLDSLAVASTFCKFIDNLIVIERILYLVEKMNQSKGISASQKRNGNTFTSTKDFSYHLSFLKEKYHEFFKKKQSMQSGNKIGPIKFNKIFEN